MSEIKCPKCKEVFKADEAGFADIQKQIRDIEFEKDLQTIKDGFERESQSAVKLAEAAIRDELRNSISTKDQELIELKVNSEKVLTETTSKKNIEIEKLKSQLDNSNREAKIALSEALEPIKKERDELVNKLKIADKNWNIPH